MGRVSRLSQTGLRFDRFRPSRRASIRAALGLFWCGLVGAQPGTTVGLRPVADTTIYSGSGTARSNGGGTTLMVGTNNAPEIRRGLLRFDPASIPAGSVIEGVSLRMVLIKAPVGEEPRVVALHRALASWGENAASDAGEGAGSGEGAPAEPGDATWSSRFFGESLPWDAPGGDFAPAPSAATVVLTDLIGYRWESPGLLADVRFWMGNPAANFGWFVLGEENLGRTNRQFSTRESSTPQSAPVLFITYAMPAPQIDEIRVDGADVTLRWRSEPGQFYQVQSTRHLEPASWIDHGAPVSADGTSVEWNAPVLPADRTLFFRLRIP